MTDNGKNEQRDLSHMKAKSPEIQDKDGDKDDFRNHFQRDRDRITYCKAFRRLASKTQVFTAGHDDHLRTRLTHTLEVSQIARTISSRLGLDLDLTEAIALGHDIGHAPFGHIGERVLNYFLNGCEQYKGFNDRFCDKDDRNQNILPESFRGFKHNWQSVRIVESLTRHKGEMGLDLSKQTVYGLLNHTKTYYAKCAERNAHKQCTLRRKNQGQVCIEPKYHLSFYKERYKEFENTKHYTIESSVVALADEIAQRQHDIEDGIRTNLITIEELDNMLSESIFSQHNSSVKTHSTVPIKALETKHEVLGIKITKDHDSIEWTILTKKNDSNSTEETKNKISSTDPNQIEDFITDLSSKVVRKYVNDVIDYLISIFRNKGFMNLNDFLCSENSLNIIKSISIESCVKGDEDLAKFLKNRILFSHIAQVMDGKAYFLLRRLFKAYISNPQQLPDNTIKSFFKAYNNEIENNHQKNTSIDIKKASSGELRTELNKLLTGDDATFKAVLLRTICDYISGMTDRKAISEYQNLYTFDKLHRVNK